MTNKFRAQLVYPPPLDSKTSLRQESNLQRSEASDKGWAKGVASSATIAFPPSILLPERSSLNRRAIDNRRLCDNSHLMPIYISVFSWIMLTALRLFAPGNPAPPSPFLPSSLPPFLPSDCEFAAASNR